jgi:amidohydrolase
LTGLAPYDEPTHQQALVTLRRELHRHPEVGFTERWTSNLIQQRMGDLGLEVRATAGTGLVATLRGGRPGPTVLVRAELDALPIQEASEATYRSEHAGAMHACGHDAHMAVATTVARRLAELRDELAGTVKFAFQPAEEIAGGAKQMVEEGALEAPSVDAVLALHVWQDLPVGTIGVAGGPIWAAVDDLTFTVYGRSGHGAMPHQTVDAIVIASQIVNALQTIVSRTRSPFAPAVLTIGSIHGGTAWNIIADRVEMRGTLRTFDPTVRDRLLGRITAIAKGIAESMEATCDVEDRYGAPPVVNNEALVEVVRAATIPLVGAERVVTNVHSAGGDDFSYFAQDKPGCMFLVGSSNAARGLDKPHHHPSFDIDEACLPIAAASLDAVIRASLRTLAQ